VFPLKSLLYIDRVSYETNSVIAHRFVVEFLQRVNIDALEREARGRKAERKESERERGGEREREREKEKGRAKGAE